MTALPRLIGLYSPAPGSGKSTIASYYCARGFHIVSLAATMKKMCRTFLLAQGIQPSQVDHYLYDDKHALIPELGVTARHLLQRLGTDWGRDCIHPDVWIRTWERQVELKLSVGIPVVCDDIRRSNEAEALLRLGGELWCITRPDVIRTTDHPSEGELDNFPTFHRRITNDGTLIDLYNRLPAAPITEREAIAP